jgi:hypothetical protein
MRFPRLERVTYSREPPAAPLEMPREASGRLDWASFYLSAFYRESLEGSLDYQYGDVVLTNIAAEVPLSHFCASPLVGAFTPGLELNYRYAEKDRTQGAKWGDGKAWRAAGLWGLPANLWWTSSGVRTREGGTSAEQWRRELRDLGCAGPSVRED